MEDATTRSRFSMPMLKPAWAWRASVQTVRTPKISPTVKIVSRTRHLFRPLHGHKLTQRLLLNGTRPRQRANPPARAHRIRRAIIGVLNQESPGQQRDQAAEIMKGSLGRITEQIKGGNTLWTHTIRMGVLNHLYYSSRFFFPKPDALFRRVRKKTFPCDSSSASCRRAGLMQSLALEVSGETEPRP